MKKQTNEEKLQLVNEACGLIAESLANIAKAKEMLLLCGIVLCDNFSCTLCEFDENSHHAQIFKGISKLESITGKQARYGVELFVDAADKSRKIIEHNGVKFLQLGHTKAGNFSYR